MHIQLSDHFNNRKLLRFAFPSIIMMIFTSLYSVVDGFFVSNFVGKSPFAAVNLIMPVLLILGSIGFMFGAGGSALVSKTMGEGDDEKAGRLFSLFVYCTAASGILIAVLAFIFIRPLAALLGAEGELLENCVVYGKILLLSLPFYMLQFEFQSFFITAEKPQLGLIVTLVCGVIPLIYFGRPKAGRLRLTKTRFDGKAILKACANGSSELMGNISASIVSMLYNVQLMKYAGEDGIAAFWDHSFSFISFAWI